MTYNRIVLSKSLFPVIVKADGKQYRQAKVMLSTEGRAVVWVSNNGNVERVLDQQEATIKPLGGRRHVVSGSEGDWECFRDGGCGCGHPLKRLNPADAFK